MPLSRIAALLVLAPALAAQAQQPQAKNELSIDGVKAALE